MKCSTCRKNELDSKWDLFKVWLIKVLFPQTVIDLKAESFTQGFGDGYKAGMQSMKDKEPQLPCPHGRSHWGHCPHCLGINKKVDYRSPCFHCGLKFNHKPDCLGKDPFHTCADCVVI